MPKIYEGVHTIAIHPSYTLDEMLEYRGMTYLDLIKGEEISKKKMYRFMKGKIGVDSEIAYLLARKLNTSINLWINLQKNYKRNLIKAKKENKKCHTKK